MELRVERLVHVTCTPLCTLYAGIPGNPHSICISSALNINSWMPLNASWLLLKLLCAPWWLKLCKLQVLILICSRITIDVTALYFFVFFFRLMSAGWERRENWTPAQNGREAVDSLFLVKKKRRVQREYIKKKITGNKSHGKWLRNVSNQSVNLSNCDNDEEIIVEITRRSSPGHMPHK